MASAGDDIAQPDSLDRMTRPELQDLFAYWQSRRNGRSMPSRADIDPLDIPRLLPFVVLVDVLENPRDYRYRLVGTDVAQSTGLDFTGTLLSESTPAKVFDRIFADYDHVVDERRPVYSEDRVAWQQRDYLRYKRIALPLSDDGEQVNMLLLGICHEV